MNNRITTILEQMKPATHADDMSVQMTRMAELLSLLAEEQAQSAAKMERQTSKLINLTRIIMILTLGLLAYTAVLCLLTFKLIH